MESSVITMLVGVVGAGRECSYRKTWTADLLVLLGGFMHAADPYFLCPDLCRTKNKCGVSDEAKNGKQHNMLQK